MPRIDKLSMGLRERLEAAGVTRPELFSDDATRKHMTWHDLRATGITWMAIRGDDPIRIQRRAGHKSFTTTEEYIREAENVREGFGRVFPPLPAGLLWPTIGPRISRSSAEAIENTRKSLVRATGFEPVTSTV